MRRLPVLAAATVVAFITYAANAQERRELGPHQHGHGKLNIAIEAGKLSFELDVPGADIVGFEYEAKTKADKAKVEKGIALLSDPLKLFVIAKGAACTVKEKKVEIERGEEPAAGKGGAGKAQHSDFNATYVFECAKPQAIDTIRFDYFKLFADADELDVNVVSPKGQKSFEVNRKNPAINLSGLL